MQGPCIKDGKGKASDILALQAVCLPLSLLLMLVLPANPQNGNRVNISSVRSLGLASADSGAFQLPTEWKQRQSPIKALDPDSRGLVPTRSPLYLATDGCKKVLLGCEVWICYKIVNGGDARDLSE